MPRKDKELRLLILSQYDSEADLARSIGWTRQRLNKITNGVKVPNVQEVNELAKALKVSTDTITKIFLKTKSPNRQLKDCV